MIGIKEVMEMLGVGRPLATRYIQRYLGKQRVKGQKYLVPKEHFIAWVQGGMK